MYHRHTITAGRRLKAAAYHNTSTPNREEIYEININADMPDILIIVMSTYFSYLCFAFALFAGITDYIRYWHNNVKR